MNLILNAKKVIKKIKMALIRYFFIKKMGNNSYVYLPFIIRGGKHIFVEDDVIIAHGSWLNVVPEVAGITPNDYCLRIGMGTHIGHHFHLSCCNQVNIGHDVLIADKVFITDHHHRYEDISLPIIKQGIYSPGPVIIGNGCWIGESVSIMPNVIIGANSIVGANSVVTKTLPKYSVAVGIPAKVIKIYNTEKKIWESAEKE